MTTADGLQMCRVHSVRKPDEQKVKSPDTVDGLLLAFDSLGTPDYSALVRHFYFFLKGVY